MYDTKCQQSILTHSGWLPTLAFTSDLLGTQNIFLYEMNVLRWWTVPGQTTKAPHPRSP